MGSLAFGTRANNGIEIDGNTIPVEQRLKIMSSDHVL